MSRPVFRLAAAVLAPAVLLSSSSLAAQTAAEGSSTTYMLRFDNDVLAGTDRCYTGGLALHRATAPRVGSANRVERFLAGGDPEAATAFHVSVAQAIYTPDDIRRSEIIPGDRPYAGVLTAGLAVPVFRDTRADLFTLTVGVVGPASGAEKSQRWVHRAIGGIDPAGWQHQLGNEPVVQLRWDRRWRGLETGGAGGFGAHLVPHAGIGLGSLSMDANLGATIRAGWNLASESGWRSIRPGGRRAATVDTGTGLRAELHATLDGRVVGRDILLDGNNFRDSHHVRRTPVTADFVVGAEAGAVRVSLLYELVFWTRKFETESRKQMYSSFAVRFR